MTMPAPSMSVRYCAPPNSAISEVRPSKGKRMKLMFIFPFILLFTFSANTAFAGEAGQCQAQGGSFLSGTVTQGPSFAAGHIRDGVELSHTHITLQGEQDGESYDVAMDNVFASGYDAAGEAVPSPLSSIAVGDKLDLCGELYQSGGVGIHWVHTDCGKSPTPSAPNGWVKIIETDGTLGPNFENSQEYCKLWP